MKGKRSLTDLEKALDFDPRSTRAYAEANLAGNLGDVIRSARLAKGHTQSDVADTMDSTQSAIARLEGGANVPTIDTLTRVAAALGQYLVIAVLDEVEVKEAGLFDKAGTGRVALFPQRTEDFARAVGATSVEDDVELAERFFGRKASVDVSTDGADATFVEDDVGLAKRFFGRRHQSRSEEPLDAES